MSFVNIHLQNDEQQPAVSSRIKKEKRDHPFSIFSVPPVGDLHPRTGLLQTVVCRESKNRIVMYLEETTTTTTTTSEEEGLERRRTVLLVAQRHRGSRFDISLSKQGSCSGEEEGENNTNTIDNFQSLLVGRMGRIRSKSLSSKYVGYSLYYTKVFRDITTTTTETYLAPVVSVLYEVPSVFTTLAQAPPRQAHVAIRYQQGDNNSNSNNNNKSSTTTTTTEATFDDDKKLDRFRCVPRQQKDPVCHEIIADNMGLSINYDDIASMTKYGLYLFDNKKSISSFPAAVVVSSSSQQQQQQRKRRSRYGLNFRGRGRLASSKNIQLIDGNGNIFLQLAKWDTNDFNLDYKGPFNAYLAFGFALAQLDL